MFAFKRIAGISNSRYHLGFNSDFCFGAICWYNEFAFSHWILWCFRPSNAYRSCQVHSFTSDSIGNSVGSVAFSWKVWGLIFYVSAGVEIMMIFCCSLYAKVLQTSFWRPWSLLDLLGGSLASPLWLHNTWFRCRSIVNSSLWHTRIAFSLRIYSGFCVLALRNNVFTENL